MRQLLTILILMPLFAVSQTTNFNFTAIPLTNDFLNQGRGAHLWSNRDAPYGTIDIPVNNNPGEMVDYYYRFTMTAFFSGNGSDSTIDFSFFRARFVEAINKRMGIRWRIMTLCNDCGDPVPPGPCPNSVNGLQSFDGGCQVFPKFLHDLMQAEPIAANRDWFSTRGDQDAWIPNWNSPQYLRWVRKLSQQIYNYVDTASHNGYRFRDAMRIYDLGFYGCYSEQHSACLCDQITDGNIPVGARHTDAGLIEIVDAQMDVWGGDPSRNWKYVVPFNAFDAIFFSNTFNTAVYGRYLLDHPDSISWIDDHIGADEGYDHAYLENNTRMGTRGGGPTYQVLLNNRWRHSPTGGEPVGWGIPADRSAIPQYVQDYHMTFFGNGNLDHIAANGQDDDGWPVEANNIRLASRLAGYRLRLTGGSATVGSNLVINLNWLNEGNAPPYENWDVKYLVKNGAGTTVATLNSNFQIRYFQPSGSATPANQTFSVPAVPAGQYSLYVKVTDPTGYRRPMRLAITPALVDTSYFLGNITISTGGTNTPPTANAGPNQSITGTSVSLNGSSSTDPDGTITTYAWTRVSGPNTPTIVSPGSANTNVTGLIAGTYVFDLTVTDDDGATGSDQVQITVQPNQPPVANAGPNQTITLPTSSTTVNGSGTDDNAVTGYSWSQQQGPNTAVIQSPTSASTVISGLIQGSYAFRLTVNDASGLTGFDDMIIFVNPGNSAPIANAGANQTLTQPISSTTVNGSASTDDQGITSYLWTQVGGPITATITSPSSVSTSITGMSTAGVYIFRLTVTDAAGLISTDDVQITVQASTPIPIANAGANITITLPTNFVALSGSGSSGIILAYAWTQISGPATATIAFPNSVNTNATNLVQGVYVFRLTVTNSSGSSSDDMTVTVLPVANTAPVANAGGNQSLTAPTSSTSVDGSASSDDVGVTAYLWTKISGPSGGTISTPTSATTNITALQVGTYVFRLTVTDAGGLTDTDDMSIVVNPAANNAPVAIIAGGAQSIQLPTSSTSLDGSGSTDDVGVTAYLWTKISGPAGGTIATPTTSTTNITALQVGVYFFQLQVTDAGGLTDTDQVQVTVLAANPDPPISGGHSQFKANIKFLPRVP